MYPNCFIYILLFFLFIINGNIHAEPYPIGFAVPEIKCVDAIPEKTRDFAFLIPGDSKTYIYTQEKEYYKGYQEAYYAVTKAKAGWDCLRHYEILCNGCIPYFIDLNNCPDQCMTFLPKDLIKEAMNLEGVSYLHIDHSRFDKSKYYELLTKLLEHTRRHLTTEAMAKYLLKTINYKGKGNILFLSQKTKSDYLRCLLLIGLKQVLRGRIVDVPKINHIYTNYQGDLLKLYGRGMTYTKIVKDLPLDRSKIRQRIANKEFDLIIYGSVHRGMPYYDLVTRYYEPEKVVYLCGEDSHDCPFKFQNNFFLREPI